MKIIQTKSHRFMAVRLDTTGNEERNELVVVQKLSMVVTPIITLAGTAFTSNQKDMNELVTSTIPGTKTVLK